MNTKTNSTGQNGSSVYGKKTEQYTVIRFKRHRDSIQYQYTYRHRDGVQYSTIAPTLEECRAKRDKWIREENGKRLFPGILQKMEQGKRLTKSEMAYQIGHVEPLHTVTISWDFFTREEIARTFNQIFGTAIK
ncbi:MAG: DUF3873 domain-containing protein [Tannerella sp.]|jgi:hypothetical protein|nr:DUF3873 domain-containing protein [Tannerella sp.]